MKYAIMICREGDGEFMRWEYVDAETKEAAENAVTVREGYEYIARAHTTFPGVGPFQQRRRARS